MSEFEVQPGAKMAWALAIVKHLHQKLLAVALAHGYNRKCCTIIYNCLLARQGICDADSVGRAAVAALAMAAKLRMSKFNAQKFANTAWAFAMLLRLDVQLLPRWRRKRSCG